MIWLTAVPKGNGCLYSKPGAEGKDVILEFDPKRPEGLKEEIFHVVLGHHRELGKGLSYKRKWEMEKEVTELKLRIGAVKINQAIMCLYNVRQGLIEDADEGRQIEGEDRWCLAWPSFLSQTVEAVGVSQDYINRYLRKALKK